ncbi:DUF6197 family protein [Nonomuraea turcica]|uniref:DUF6197 family protein n=1 Tax=Nonomuraea sp. G32 TaxID=3067274 RepID=UPI00273BE146|nr:hypothetical protein [Nonomuraea sp. G32]MDP4501018.1 hypothetical protein [Nonomuraea sp. G32]
MTTTLDLAAAPVLLRAANIITQHGHATGDFNPDSGGYDIPGAIAEASGISPDDWDDTAAGRPTLRDYDTAADHETALAEWKAGRRASLAALRTLLSHLDGAARPEDMSRKELIERISLWNDHDDRTPAEVITALRTAAEAVTPWPTKPGP